MPNACVPNSFPPVAEEIVELALSIEGHLSAKEIRFLALLAACPTTRGDILEVGSFKGRSTIVLARAAALANSGRVVAVDPMSAPCETDPDLGTATSSLSDFLANIERAGVAECIEFHQVYSSDLASKWNRSLRLLWIDGDHTYPGVLKDLDMFQPFLADGAIVAFHDLLHQFEGPDRVFADRVLASEQFGAAGICGSIGWAQHLKEATPTPAERLVKEFLLSRLRPIQKLVMNSQPLTGFRQLAYRLHRMRIPHGEVSPQEWVTMVRTGIVALPDQSLDG